MSGLRLRICLAVISAAWGAGCTDSIGAVVATDAGEDTPMKDGGSVDNNGGGNGDNNNNGETDAGPACESGFTRRAGECLDVDECANANSCDANATCTNTQGSFTCTCASGYAGDGKTCVDVDECAQADACTSSIAICTNTEGSFSCACPPGYMGDPSTCTDKNECVTNNGECGDALYVACTNNPGAAPTCTDINNCLVNNGGCGNGNAEYATCTDNDKTAPTCTDVDACATDNGKCGGVDYATCVDNDKAAPTCIDINNCAANNGGCTSPAIVCTDNDKAAPTCTVPADPCQIDNGGCTGFQSCVNNGGVASCVDFNECNDGNNGGCGLVGQATCTNNVGAAPTCADINECNDGNNGGCGTKQCVNKIRTGRDCVDTNLCGTNNGNCGDPAFFGCNDSSGAVVCSDINECLTNNGGCGDSAAMTCKDETGARNSCTDIDECANAALNDCPADKPCINVKGSYFCGCEYPNVFDRDTGICRPARVLVLDDGGGTTLLADLQAAGFSATGGGLYYQWNQSPDLSNFDTVLWLEGKEGQYGKQLLPGVDQLIASFVASGGGLVRTEWGLWYATVQKVLGNASVNPASVGVMPLGLPAVARYKNAGTSWTVTNTSSPLTRNLPATFAATGGYALLTLLPGSESVATTLDSRVINSVTVETVVPVLTYTAIHGGITVHVNDTLLYTNGTRTTLPADFKQVYLNAAYFSAQRTQ